MKFKNFIVAAAAAVATIAAPAVLAHAKLEGSSPQANSVVSPAPAQVRLQFNEPLELPFSKVRLVDEKGAIVEPSKIAVDPADAKALIASTPGLHSGAYRVQWTTVTRDGHKVKGEFSFRVK
ncbi:copper homeostasis periplasmic binding protein CopC [Massilia sp. G4R7]|uniref:Copper homeostasis periplasmic binding protein CopC n=1 Tax=Massilia phyllostachyos TaxID=2898585 RepID=A0ABS8Q816_9BURK|nr:copper homeostasis periplasmic binding protein CopC [Massilia phyllostachyos]MCD2516755.1 copper homeostasis periplasmic binding protein CopC [Massilia phyllostachyos]